MSKKPVEMDDEEYAMLAVDAIINLLTTISGQLAEIDRKMYRF